MPSHPAPSALAAGAKRCAAPAKAAAARRLESLQNTCPFSTTACQQKTSKLRSDMYQWYDQGRGGAQYRDAPDGPRYLGNLPNQPFPMNPLFQSQPVLDEGMREEIYKRVKKQNLSLKAVSADLGVDVRRVAAVVRMKAIEKQWEAERKPMAKPYAKAVLKMLPKTSYNPGNQQPHEPVNDLHVHKLTMQQLFVPVPESREFTREDAAKAFHRNMLTPDARSPHPELIELQRSVREGKPLKEGIWKFQADTRAEEDTLLEKEARRREAEEQATTRVDTGRFEYRFKDVNIDTAGKDGRGRRGVGWRYGVPYDDRKKGKSNIPTSVP